MWEGADSLLKLSFLSPDPLCHLFPLQHPSSSVHCAKQLSGTQQKPGELLGGCLGMAPSQGKHSGQILAAWESSSGVQHCSSRAVLGTLLNLNPREQHQDTELWAHCAEWERRCEHITEALGFDLK